jgi:protein-disulfide isomerase
MDRGRWVATWLALVLALASAACGDTSSTSPTPTTPLPSASVMLADKVLGNVNAPVTMVEYSSLTCSHCGDYHVMTFPLLKASYVDTGRMKVVFRDFPLNEAAIAGSMVARCAGDNFFAVIDALFKAQSSWAYSSDYKSGIKAVVAPLGMTSSDVEACLASTELRNGVLAIKSTGAATYGINGTPTFLINGRTVVGALSYAEFAAIINGL